jgi:hypothetical protein
MEEKSLPEKLQGYSPGIAPDLGRVADQEGTRAPREKIWLPESF